MLRLLHETNGVVMNAPMSAAGVVLSTEAETTRQHQQHALPARLQQHGGPATPRREQKSPKGTPRRRGGPSPPPASDATEGAAALPALLSIDDAAVAREARCRLMGSSAEETSRIDVGPPRSVALLGATAQMKSAHGSGGYSHSTPSVAAGSSRPSSGRPTTSTTAQATQSHQPRWPASSRPATGSGAPAASRFAAVLSSSQGLVGSGGEGATSTMDAASKSNSTRAFLHSLVHAALVPAMPPSGVASPRSHTARGAVPPPSSVHNRVAYRRQCRDVSSLVAEVARQLVDHPHAAAGGSAY